MDPDGWNGLFFGPSHTHTHTLTLTLTLAHLHTLTHLQHFYTHPDTRTLKYTYTIFKTSTHTLRLTGRNCTQDIHKARTYETHELHGVRIAKHTLSTHKSHTEAQA